MNSILSFVIPAHNEAALLGATLASIQTAAQATGEAFELIVVDDASTDRTAEIAQACGASVVPVNVRKIAAVRNAGAKVARGDVLIFVDADTLVPERTLSAALDALQRGAIGGGAGIRLDEDVPRWGRAVTGVVGAIMYWLRLAAGCFLFARRDAFEAVGGFDEAYFATEELHLSRAPARQGRFVIVRESVITSGRKFRMFSAWYFLKVLALFLLGGGFRRVRRREGLELWYESPR